VRLIITCSHLFFIKLNSSTISDNIATICFHKNNIFSVDPKSLASFSHDSLADFSFALVRVQGLLRALVPLAMVFSMGLQAPVPVVPVALLVLVAARLQDSQSVLAFQTPHLILYTIHH
jgi:hypothetical protein